MNVLLFLFTFLEKILNILSAPNVLSGCGCTLQSEILNILSAPMSLVDAVGLHFTVRNLKVATAWPCFFVLTVSEPVVLSGDKLCVSNLSLICKGGILWGPLYFL